MTTRIWTAAPLVLLLGCDEFADAMQQAQDAAQQAQDAAQQAQDANQKPMSEDDLLGQKLNHYVGCINSFSKSVLDNRARYLQWCDAEKGPTGKERSVYGLYSMNDPKTCIEGIEKAAGQKPADADIEKAAKEFADALKKAHPIVNDAHKYYDEKDYKDDKFAKGKELHPKLIAAFGEFEVANSKLRKLLAERNDALQVRRLATTEKEEGRKAKWHHLNMMQVAKKLIEAGDIQKWEDLDMAKFEPAFKNFEKAVADLEQYADANKEEVKQYTHAYDRLRSSANDYRKAAKELLRRKRDNKKYTRGELPRIGRPSEFTVEGSPGKFHRAYNDLVSTSNGV